MGEHNINIKVGNYHILSDGLNVSACVYCKDGKTKKEFFGYCNDFNGLYKELAKSKKRGIKTLRETVYAIKLLEDECLDLVSDMDVNTMAKAYEKRNKRRKHAADLVTEAGSYEIVNDRFSIAVYDKNEKHNKNFNGSPLVDSRINRMTGWSTDYKTCLILYIHQLINTERSRKLETLEKAIKKDKKFIKKLRDAILNDKNIAS